MSTVQKARMVYAIATLSQLPGWYLQNVLGDSWEKQLDDALDLVRGPNSGLLDHLRLNLNSRDGYPKVIEIAGKQGLIDAKVASVPLCQPKVMIVRNQPCLVITTEFTSATVSLKDLKDVIDPVNWARCLSTFFCEMDGKADRGDGWSRVLEQVSITCPIAPTHMKTPLKYWKTEGQDEKTLPPTACLDYALDDQPADDAKGDGLIVVDEGFIRMTSTDPSLDPTKPGVRVRTRKVVGFANSALTPWGILACSMGYGDQGIDMILDGVENRAKDPHANDRTAGGIGKRRRRPRRRVPGSRKMHRRKRRRLANQIPVVVLSSWPSRWSTSTSTTCPERARPSPPSGPPEQCRSPR